MIRAIFTNPDLEESCSDWNSYVQENFFNLPPLPLPPLLVRFMMNLWWRSCSPLAKKLCPGNDTYESFSYDGEVLNNIISQGYSLGMTGGAELCHGCWVLEMKLACSHVCKDEKDGCSNKDMKFSFKEITSLSGYWFLLCEVVTWDSAVTKVISSCSADGYEIVERTWSWDKFL